VSQNKSFLLKFFFLQVCVTVAKKDLTQ
jgi:hypothetical protein